MLCRTACKLFKTVGIVIIYYVTYSLFSFALTPYAPITFVSNEFRVGDKYVLMFLVAPPQPVFTDTDGADVFAQKRCGKCFITNNKGFLPMTEYDAVLVYGKRSLLAEAEAVMEPDKRYLIETTSRCVENKLRGCVREPEIISFATHESYTLCSLCDHLMRQKRESTL